jgi:hypothetical protein
MAPSRGSSLGSPPWGLIGYFAFENVLQTKYGKIPGVDMKVLGACALWSVT